MNELQIFENPDFGEIRIYVEPDGTVLFCGSDVAKALGYVNPNKAINDHCRAITKRSTPISGKFQEINYIPEGDVYRLAVSSKLPGAVKFESWVFDEILPTIRKTGNYSFQQPTQLKDYIESVAVAAQMLQLNNVSKIIMLKKAFEAKGQPTTFLPDYTEGRAKFSASTLLKKFDVPFKSVEFNKRMEAAGLLEHKERPSKTKGVKKFWSLTETGLTFGENQISPANPRETQPLYYEDTFPQLVQRLEEY